MKFALVIAPHPGGLYKAELPTILVTGNPLSTISTQTAIRERIMSMALASLSAKLRRREQVSYDDAVVLAGYKDALCIPLGARIAIAIGNRMVELNITEQQVVKATGLSLKQVQRAMSLTLPALLENLELIASSVGISLGIHFTYMGGEISNSPQQ